MTDTEPPGMRAALKQLGFNEVYHMINVIQAKHTEPRKWIEAYKGKYTDEREPFTKEEWDDLLGQSQACIDLPGVLFSVELAEMYPEAKVIIQTRDAEKWYASVLDTVYPAFHPKGWKYLLRSYAGFLDPDARSYVEFQRIMERSMGFDHAAEKDKAIAWFHEQYDTFREGIAKDRCIEYDISEGWKPLCEHLGVPIPMIRDDKTGQLVEAPFPRVNDKAQFVDRLNQSYSYMADMANLYLFAATGKLAVTAGLVYGGLRLWQRFGVAR